MRSLTTVQVYDDDLERIKTLARHLTEDGPGRFFNADAVKWALDAVENAQSDTEEPR